MANLTPTPGFGPVFQLETSTQALGGPGGPMNLQAQALLNAVEALRHPVVAVTVLSRALTTEDEQKYLRFTADGAKSLTLSSGAGFALPQEFHVANRASAGNLTLIPTGITLNAPKGGNLVLEPGDTVTIKFVGVNVADVFGSTEAA